jgi:hypothetical protein
MRRWPNWTAAAIRPGGGWHSRSCWLISSACGGCASGCGAKPRRRWPAGWRLKPAISGAAALHTHRRSAAGIGGDRRRSCPAPPDAALAAGRCRLRQDRGGRRCRAAGGGKWCPGGADGAPPNCWRNSITAIFRTGWNGLGVEVAWLTGRLTGKARQSAVGATGQRCCSGRGRHPRPVSGIGDFCRFGAGDRGRTASLRRPSAAWRCARRAGRARCPHQLIMTATPIPAYLGDECLRRS